ncbi:MAG TPA: type II toxin-antitoxin system RelE/ParE family toxin [Thermoanaerobaculia bacterium]
MKAVRLHPAAQAELLSATDWYLARSEGAAANFVHEVEHAIARIGESPERYPVTRFSRRRFVLLNFPFDIVYRIVGAEVEIIAIAHHARRPGYWRGR